MRFKTNSETLKLEFVLDWFCSRSYFAVEVLVDGKVLTVYKNYEASLEEVKRPKTWLIYGDSITQGYDAVLPESRYAYRLCKHFLKISI